MVEEKRMGAVNPQLLLKALSPLLGEEGGVKGVAECVRIVNLMKDSNKLVSRCVYLNVLKSTKDQDVLKKFIGCGGWDTLNTWLQESREEDSIAFLIELLKVYKVMPVTIDLLKQNNTAKTVKQLSKGENERVKMLSTAIVNLWMEKIKSNKSQTDAESKNNDSSTKHKTKEKKEKHREKNTHHSHHTHLKKESLHKDSKDKNASEHSSLVSVSSSSKTNVKPGQEKSRPSSAKTAPHKFRSTGLEQENVLPPSKKKKNTPDKTASKRPSSVKPVNTSGHPPEKKPKSSDITTSSSSKTSVKAKDNITGVTKEESHGKIKLIPPKPKPPKVEVYESSGFMDAITTSYVPNSKIPKKKKTSVSSPTSTKSSSGLSHQNSGGSDNRSPITTSPPHSLAKDGVAVALSFYKDTMEESSTEKDKEEDVETESIKSEDKKDEDAKSVASTASDASSNKKKRKKVSWVPDKELRTIYYFEMDETERVNVNKVKNFEDIKKQQALMERQAIENAKKLSHEREDRNSGWVAPPLLTGIVLPTTVVPGCNSTERDTQKQREEGVLQALYFAKHMIPDTAKEPDTEEFEYEEPRIIPLDDETGNGETLVDFSQVDRVAKAKAGLLDNHTEDTNSQAAFSLPPEIASMLSNMAGQLTSNAPSVSQKPDGTAVNGDSGSLAGSATTGAMAAGDFSQGIPQNMQHMLQSIVGNNQQQESSNEDDEWFKQLRTMIEPFKDQIQGLLNETKPPAAIPSLLNEIPPPPIVPGPGLLGPPPHGYGPGRGPPPPMGGIMPGPPPPPWHMHGGVMGPGGFPHGGPMFRGRGGPRHFGPQRGGRGAPYRRGGDFNWQRGRPPHRGGGGREREVCRNYVAGKCNRGPSCNYLHVLPDKGRGRGGSSRTDSGTSNRSPQQT